MKRLSALLLVALPLVLVLTAFAISANAATMTIEPEYRAQHVIELPKYPNDVQALHAEAWYYACAFSRYDCSGLTAPIVVYEDMSDEPGLLGQYWRGSKMIALNETLRGDKTGMELIVLVHEMTHYLQYNRGAWEAPFTKKRNCGLEEEAFNVGAKVMQFVLEIYDYRMRGWDAIRANTYGCLAPAH